MVALAGQGAHVFLACRDQAKALAAIERANKDIKELYPNLSTEPKLDFLELDLNDLKKCRLAAETFLSKGLPLHLLVNNSGIQSEFELSVDGIENTFAVNHLG